MAETIQELLVDPRCQYHISATVLCEKMFSAVLIRRILARIAGLRYCMIFQGRMSGASVSPPKRGMPFAFAMVLRCELSRACECVRLRVFRKFGRRVLAEPLSAERDRGADHRLLQRRSVRVGL